MDEPSSHTRLTSRPHYTSVAAYLFIFVVCSLSVVAASWLLPPLSFIFGTGFFSFFLTAILVFLVFVLFRKLIFKQLYGKAPTESEEVLLAYFSKDTNHNGHNRDENVSVELIENALHLREVFTADCITPRDEIVFLSADASVEQLKALFVESQLSRIIITEGNTLDNIIGYIHVQQMFVKASSIRRMVMPIRVVPDTTPANDLLGGFVRSRTNIACVSNAENHVIGIVTMEDALEQLFGAIDDEHD